jgi:hypothetical protein
MGLIGIFMRYFFLLFLMIPCIVMADYDDCILENMKSAGSREAALLIMTACRSKYPLPPIPAKCANLPDREALDWFSGINPRQQCIDECNKESYWSRHFGDCKP